MSLSAEEIDEIFKEDEEYASWLKECEADGEEWSENEDDARDVEMADVGAGGDEEQASNDVAVEHNKRQCTAAESVQAWRGCRVKTLFSVWNGDARCFPEPPTIPLHAVTSPELTFPLVSMNVLALPTASAEVYPEHVLAVKIFDHLRGIRSSIFTVVQQRQQQGGDPTTDFCERHVLRAEVAVEGLSPVALRNLCDPLLRVSSDFANIKKTIEFLADRCNIYSPSAAPDLEADQRTPSIAALVPVLKKVATAILRSANAFVHLLSTSKRCPSLPWLARVVKQSGLAATARQLKSIIASAFSLSSDPVGATVLLSRLHRSASKAETQGSRCSLPGMFLSECLQPYLSELSAWMHAGKVSSEFSAEPLVFITHGPAKAALDPYVHWDTRWKIDWGKLPCFVTKELAKSVETAGKSARFLFSLRQRVLAGDTESFVEGREAAGSGLPFRSQQEPDSRVAFHVPAADLNRAFKATLRPKLDLGRTLDDARLATLVFDGRCANIPAEKMAEVHKPLLDFFLVTLPLGDQSVATRQPKLHAEWTASAVHGQPLGQAVSDAFREVIQAQCTAVGGVLSRALRAYCCIDENLQLLSGVFLLQSGAAMLYFCTKHLFKIAQRGDWLNKPSSDELKARFDESVLAVSDSSAVRSALKLVVRWEEDGNDAASLRFSPNDDTPRKPLDKPPPPNAMRIVTGFVLQLHAAGPQSPLHIVFPHSVTNAYSRVLQVLLLVAYAQHLLVTMRLPRLPWPASDLEKQIAVARLHLLHFIQALNDHLLQRTTALWKQGMDNVSRATDIESLRNSHMQLSQSLLEAVNFSCKRREHWTTLLSITRLIVRFEEGTSLYIDWMRDVAVTQSVRGVTCASAVSSRDALSLPPPVSEAVRHLPTIIRNDIMAQFVRHMKFFVATLKSQGGTVRSSEMLAAFDFNGIYSDKR
ncbi:hypothetical protein DIPPA_13774 [Diplonema papillatum]|nr:hypothetical protein DIPPA_13774 [Diplonema papillatum]